MNIRMITSAAGPAGAFERGKEYNVNDKLGEQFVKAGAATNLDKPARKPSKKAETATDPAA